MKPDYDTDTQKRGWGGLGGGVEEVERERNQDFSGTI